MIDEQLVKLTDYLAAIVQILKKIEENTRLETVEEKRSRIRGFENEKDNAPF